MDRLRILAFAEPVTLRLDTVFSIAPARSRGRVASMSQYPAIPTERKMGNEQFYSSFGPSPVSLIDFWRWSLSDLVTNSSRGILAEFLVAAALGLADGVRTNWEAFDLKLPNGVSVEVKSASYLQSWHQKSLSPITFSIRETQDWDPVAGYGTSRKRQADIYVFCLLAHKEKATLDPLNLVQWQFYVIPTNRINEIAPSQKSIRLTTLESSGFRSVTYESLADAVRSLSDKIETARLAAKI